MKLYLTCLTLFLCFPIIAQRLKLNIDEIDVNIGWLASDLFNSHFVIKDTLFGKNYLPSSTRIAYSNRVDIVLRRQISENHTLGIGFAIKKLKYLSRFELLFNNEQVDISETFNYGTVQFNFQSKIASNRILGLHFESGLQLDFYQPRGIEAFMRPVSFSLLNKMNAYFIIDKRNQIIFSPTINLPISRYNKKGITPAFYPFNYGVCIGYSRKV